MRVKTIRTMQDKEALEAQEKVLERKLQAVRETLKALGRNK